MGGGRLPAQPLPNVPGYAQNSRDQQLSELLAAINETPRPVLLTGTPDPQSPTGFTDGIAFVNGVAQTLDHGAGGEVVAFLEVPMAGQTARAGLAPTYTAGLDLTKQIRLTPSATARCWLLLFVRGGP